MKLRSVRVLILSFAFLGLACLPQLLAQQTPTDSNSQTDRCVRWMKATVSSQLRDVLDPGDFCSGIKRSSTDGWYSVYKCGDFASQSAQAAPKYCTSSGQFTEKESWAAGFSSSSKDGGELLSEEADQSKDSRRAAAVFFSRTAAWMEGLRVPAGMYELRPSKSSEGWKLAVAKQEESASEADRSVGEVALKVAAVDQPLGNLAISTKPLSERCPGPAVDGAARELHFIYGATDLFVCIRPDQVSVSQQSKVVPTSVTIR